MTGTKTVHMKPLFYLIGRTWFFITGWKLVGSRPPLDKYVILAGPHTSNWDVPYMLAIACMFGIRVRWIGKHTLFHWPYGWFIRLVGGMPVDRRARHNVVEQIVEHFKSTDYLPLLITPEGTRGRAEYWKSGFYHIARGANVPVVFGHIDYAKKQGGLETIYHLTGDVDADMQAIRDYFKDRTAKYPECYGPIRLRPAEDASTENEKSATHRIG